MSLVHLGNTACLPCWSDPSSDLYSWSHPFLAAAKAEHSAFPTAGLCQASPPSIPVRPLRASNNAYRLPGVWPCYQELQWKCGEWMQVRKVGFMDGFFPFHMPRILWAQKLPQATLPHFRTCSQLGMSSFMSDFFLSICYCLSPSTCFLRIMFSKKLLLPCWIF